MNHKLLLSAALAGIMSAGVAMTANASATEDTSKEKCYGIAMAGKNDCASADGKHSCAGAATTDNDPAEWVHVNKGECESKGGKTEAPKM